MNRYHWVALLALMFWVSLSLFAKPPVSHAQAAAEDVCPVTGVQPRTADFTGGGLILTTFDRRSMWVFNVERSSRYPLEGTRPCKANCHLSPDARWITVYNAPDETFDKMRLDGSQRVPIAKRVTDAEWWSDDTLIVWTAAHTPALQLEGSDERETFSAVRVYSIQPQGRWALKMLLEGDYFVRTLVNLDSPEQVYPLSPDTAFFNAFAWSPDGDWLAYVGQVTQNGVTSAELFAVDPSFGAFPNQWTQLTQQRGAVRIGGQSAAHGLSWSPDGRKLAFWVSPYKGGDEPTPDDGDAYIYLYDVAAGKLTRYCGFATRDHAPNPPRLVWSPDARYIAFGADDPDDPRGNLLIALDVTSGVFTELSAGLSNALGTADVITWGLP